MLDLFGQEMPLAVRFFLASIILLAVVGVIAALVWAGVHFLGTRTTSPRIISHDRGASLLFKVLFWVHQILLGLPSITIGLDLLTEGKTVGIVYAIGFLLAWIGGTLVWGLAAIMHQRPVYELPSFLATMAESVARLEKLQTHDKAVGAVADALQASNTTVETNAVQVAPE
jgi:hypothetical protein